jgi:CelD/BcsL family acetyltransferase involved in cellulose biosynthesis
LAAWDRLTERAIEPNPFFERGFVTTACEQLGKIDVGVLFVEVDDGWAGCMPVHVTRALGLPLVVSSWKHPYSFLGTPLVDGDRLAEFSAALMRSVSQRDQGRYLALRRISGGPVLDSIRRAAKTIKADVLFERSFERAALERRPEADYTSGLKSKRRSELKRQRRRLGESLDVEVEARDRPDVVNAIEAFLLLESSGWKGENGTAMSSDPRSANFFRTMCADFAAAGRLRIRSLEAGDRVLAMTVDLRAGDSLFGFKTAFDEELARFSPGIQLQIDNFADFHEHCSERYIDSCSEPDNETMNSLWPDRRTVATLLLGQRGIASGAIGRGLNAAYEIRRRRRA